MFRTHSNWKSDTVARQSEKRTSTDSLQPLSSPFSRASIRAVRSLRFTQHEQHGHGVSLLRRMILFAHGWACWKIFSTPLFHVLTHPPPSPCQLVPFPFPSQNVVCARCTALLVGGEDLDYSTMGVGVGWSKHNTHAEQENRNSLVRSHRWYSRSCLNRFESEDELCSALWTRWEGQPAAQFNHPATTHKQ